MKNMLPLLLLATILSLGAQDNFKTYHFLSSDLGVNQVKEENLLPKKSSGIIVELAYGLDMRKKHWQQFHLAGGYSRLKTAWEDVSKTVNLKLNAGYSYNLPVLRKNRFAYYLGPEGSVAYNASYLPNWDDSHLYWADYFSIGLKNNFTMRCGDQKEWVTSVSFPLFSVFSRPEWYRLYKIDDITAGGIAANLNSRLTPAHLRNVFFVRVQTACLFPLFGNKKESFGYSFEWQRVKHDDSRAFQQITHTLGLKIFL